MSNPSYYYAAGPHPRSSYTHNPATTSMPTSVGYSSMYAGDMHILPSSSSSHQRQMTSPRGYYHSTNPQGVPTTTRTYAVNHDSSRPKASPPQSSRDASRARRSTLDSTSRPPVVVTTSHKDRPGPSSSSHTTNHTAGHRSGSPSRTSDLAYGKAYYENTPSTRSRHHTRRYSGSEDYGRGRGEDYSRGRDRESSLSRRDADSYRSRPAVYQDPRHSSALVDYAGGDFGTDGFQYTNAGELAKYDLANPKASRRRRDSVDRGYHRPSMSYGGTGGGEQPVTTVNATPEPSRPYSSAGGRVYEGRGPPPSTRGFDRINPTYPDSRPAPQNAPVTSSPTQSSHFEVVEGAGRRGRPRPLSLYQEVPARSSHHDDYYRSRDEDRHMRQVRDRDANVPQASPSFYDQSVPSRGFGIRTGPVDGLDGKERRDESTRRPRRDESERRWRDESARRHGRRDESERRRRDESAQRHGRRDESERRHRRQEPINRSDESVKRDSDNEKRERRHRPVSSVDSRMERKGSDDEQKERTRLRDKVTGGLGIAAAAVGLAPLRKEERKDEPRESEHRRRRSPDEEKERRDEPRGSGHRRRRSPSDEYVRKEERREKDRGTESHESPPPPAEKDTTRPSPAEARGDGDAPDREERPLALPSTAEDDGNRSFRRRHRPSHGFDPNDASDLIKLKEQLAAMKTSEREREREPVEPSTQASDKEKERDLQARVEDEEPPRSQSPKDRDVAVVDSPHGSASPKESTSSRGREDRNSNDASTKQVRLVSPPRQQNPTPAVRGILKQPSPRFPEDENPVREGVAPHKEDKKLKEVPPGARWTKISRSKVNPEALEYGKERYEVRDDFVIVLRVLSKEEIQAYAHATQILRERRRNPDKAKDAPKEIKDAESSDEEGDDESREERQRHRRASDEGRRERRRHKRDEDRREDDEEGGEYGHHHRHHQSSGHSGQHHQRSFRERERERQSTF